MTPEPRIFTPPAAVNVVGHSFEDVLEEAPTLYCKEASGP